jgi:hypothetical protein
MSKLDQKFGNVPIDAEFPQSRLDSRLDLVDVPAMLRLGHVLWYGAERYGVNNWRTIPQEHHLNRIMYHVLQYLGGDRSEDHLSHAFTRAMFAIGTETRGSGENVPDERAPWRNE